MKSTKEHKNKSTHSKSTPDQPRDENENLKFPGYPPYDPDEDIMNKGKRIDVNLEDEANIENINEEYTRKTKSLTNIDEPLIDNRSEVTKDDLEALGPKDLSLDMGEDEELLKHRVYPVDFSAKDLDIPGSELDNANEAIGSEDEENNSYSLGGDAHENLEEDRA
jgi:hypothetical protein